MQNEIQIAWTLPFQRLDDTLFRAGLPPLTDCAGYLALAATGLVLSQASLTTACLALIVALALAPSLSSWFTFAVSTALLRALVRNGLMRTLRPTLLAHERFPKAQLLQQCPSLAVFQPVALLGGNLTTLILSFFCPTELAPLKSESLTLADGGTVRLDWCYKSGCT